MRDGPILILTASAGAGHNMAARAVGEALEAEAPDIPFEVIDILDKSNPFFRALYSRGYIWLIRYWPTGMGILYETTDRDQPARDRFRRLFQNLNLVPFRRYLRRMRPRLIINTHFLPAEIVADMRRAGKLDSPQATVTTDFETHRLWVNEPTDRYYTATELGKAFLCTWGVDPARVRATGIPVRLAFESPAERQEARKRQGLDVELPTVLLLSGGFGVGPTEDLVQRLLASAGPLQLVVSAGRNAALLGRLNALRSRLQRPLHVIGYTDRIHEFMAASDLVVSKPGGLTASETLACGVPLAIVNPIPGQEARNSDYLIEQGAAIKINNARLLAWRVEELLRDPARLARMREAARSLARPDAARVIVRDALGLLRRTGEAGQFDKAAIGQKNRGGVPGALSRV